MCPSFSVPVNGSAARLRRMGANPPLAPPRLGRGISESYTPASPTWTAMRFGAAKAVSRACNLRKASRRGLLSIMRAAFASADGWPDEE